MLKKLTIINMLVVSLAMATTPAKPGVTPTTAVIEQAGIMAQSHGQSGLAKKMQRVKQRNLQLPEGSLRELREDVYGSFPVILGSYSDSNDPAGTASALQSELFDGPWPTITMTEHYEEMSYGQFHLSGTVYGWYELSETGFFYGGTDNGWDGGVSSFLTETLDLADVDIDFTQYDNDGDDGVPNSGDDDGVADVVFFVHSGAGGETGAANIWSHSWNYAGAAGGGESFVTNDVGFDGNPILVNDYIIQPAENGDGNLIEIGVFSHEFGHAIGLPDLYDTDYSSDGIGNWCLMAGGSWTSEDSPAHMSAWCKEVLGWVTPVVADSNITDLSIPPVVETGYVLKLWTEGDLDPWQSGFAQQLQVGREYFLVENRQIQGTDQHLEGTGLMIYHVDNSQWSNRDDEHRLVDIEPANGQEGGTNPGQPWSATSENQRFDFQTNPSSMNYSGENTQVALFDFYDSDSMWVTASTEVVEAFPHLNILDVAVTDANNDGFLSPAENGEIWVDLVNYGVLTTGITATIIPGHPAFNFTSSTIDFDDLATNTSGSSTSSFEFTMSSEFERGTAVLEIAVSNTFSANIDTMSFEMIIGDPQVALIDADGALSGDSDVQEYYASALRDNDIVFATWDLASEGLPAEDWLLAKPQVIWFTGSAQLPLTQDVITLISSYQDAGGRLMLTGQDLTDGDEVQAAFLREYCAAELDEETTSNPRYAFGNPDHELMTASDQFRINTHYGANNQTSPDVVTHMSYGEPLFQYPRLDYRSAGVTTIRNGYKTIFLAFGFEALASLEDEGPVIRADLMSRFLDWFEVGYVGVDKARPSLPEAPHISAMYPNPFNPELTISYSLPEMMDISMIIYDISGREVAQLMRGEQSGGIHSLKWRGVNDAGLQVSTGVYFCRLEAGEVSQTMKVVYLK